MAESGFKNVQIEDGRVTLTAPPSKLKTGIAVGAFVLFLYMVFIEDGFPFYHFSLLYCLVILIVAAVCAWYIDRQRQTTVFDAGAGKVFRRNWFRELAPIDFSEIAGVQTVTHDDSGSHTKYLNLAMTSDVYGKGYRLTDHYSGTETEWIYLTTTALPAVEQILSASPGWNSPAEPVAPLVLPEQPLFYKKLGNQYIRSFPVRSFALLAVGLALAVQQLASGNLAGAGVGVAAMALSALFVFRITLDVDSKAIRIARAFGVWEKRIPFDSFDGISVTRSTYNGVATGTTLEMVFHDRKNIPLAHALRTRKLQPLAEETTQIIRAALSTDDESASA